MPGAGQQGQLGDQVLGGPGLVPAAIQLVPARPRVPADRRTGGSPSDSGGLLDDPSSPPIPDQKDPLSEVFEPMDEPAAPAPQQTPAAPVPGTPEGAVPATTPPPSPVVPADPDVGLDDSGLGSVDQTDLGTPVDEVDVPEADPAAPVDEVDVPEADPAAPVDEVDVPEADPAAPVDEVDAPPAGDTG